MIEDVQHGKIVCSDPRERRRPHDGALAAAGALAGDRGRARRRRRLARTRPRCPARSASTSAAAASCPGSPTRTCTSRPGRWRSTRCGSRTRAPSRRRSRACARRSTSRARWLRGRGWRSGDWSPPVEPTRHDLDAIAPDRPVALMARDSHSVWLNSAALARANGDLQVPGGVVELDERGEPTGVLREESCWNFRDRYIETTDDEYVEAMRAGVRLAASRGVTAVHDKDGWLGALRFWQRLEAEGSLCLRVWQSLPTDFAGELAQVDVRSGLGGPLLRVGYLKAFMDGTLGSETARMLDGSGVEITSREAVRAVHPRRAARRLPGRRPRDRRPGQPRGARRLRGDPRRLAAARPAPADRARAAARARGRPSLRRARDRRLGAVQPRALRPRPGRPLLGRARRASRTPSARCSTRAPCSRTARTRRSRSSTRCSGIRAGVARTLDEREAWHPEQALTVEQALHATTVAPAWLAGDERRRGKLVPGYLADLVVLDRDPLACEPEELAEVQVVATMLGGAWTHNPPPW